MTAVLWHEWIDDFRHPDNQFHSSYYVGTPDLDGMPNKDLFMVLWCILLETINSIKAMSLVSKEQK